MYTPSKVRIKSLEDDVQTMKTEIVEFKTSNTFLANKVNVLETEVQELRTENISIKDALRKHEKELKRQNLEIQYLNKSNIEIMLHKEFSGRCPTKSEYQTETRKLTQEYRDRFLNVEDRHDEGYIYHGSSTSSISVDDDLVSDILGNTAVRQKNSDTIETIPNVPVVHTVELYDTIWEIRERTIGDWFIEKTIGTKTGKVEFSSKSKQVVLYSIGTLFQTLKLSGDTEEEE